MTPRHDFMPLQTILEQLSATYVQHWAALQQLSAKNDQLASEPTLHTDQLIHFTELFQMLLATLQQFYQPPQPP